MIYTVTFNPSLDYIVNIKKLTLGDVNRTCSEEIFPGGKGINVSIMLKHLGIESQMFGFTAGFTGREIESLLLREGCSNEFIPVKEGMSRINVKIKSDRESEINGQGPKITEDNINELLNKLDRLKEDDILVLAGSIPSALPKNIYEKICERLQGRGIKFVVDATGALLMNVLKYNPFLIKPNNHELEDIAKRKLKTEEDLINEGKKLQEMGAQNVLISRASKGAMLITQDGKVYSSSSPKGVVKNSVGAGDSMVAGFIAGFLKNGDYEEAFKLGVASGSATAFSMWLGEKDKIMELYNTL